MKAEVNSEFDRHNIRSGPKTCCIVLHFKRAAENQLRTCHTCAPAAVLSDKLEIFQLFALKLFDEYRIRQKWPIFERRRIRTSSHPYLYESRPINKLQNGIIMLIFKMRKIRNIRFVCI